MPAATDTSCSCESVLHGLVDLLALTVSASHEAVAIAVAGKHYDAALAVERLLTQRSTIGRELASLPDDLRCVIELSFDMICRRVDARIAEVRDRLGRHHSATGGTRSDGGTSVPDRNPTLRAPEFP